MELQHQLAQTSRNLGIATVSTFALLLVPLNAGLVVAVVVWVAVPVGVAMNLRQAPSDVNRRARVLALVGFVLLATGLLCLAGPELAASLGTPVALMGFVLLLVGAVRSHAAPTTVVPSFSATRTRLVAVLLLVSVVLGLPAYVISFLFAYGFEEDVTWGNHITFLVLLTIFAVVTGLIVAALPVGGRRPVRSRRRVGFALLASFALNAAVIGAGSIVSATHKSEGSVSVDFSTTTDVLVASSCFIVALVCAASAAFVRVDA